MNKLLLSQRKIGLGAARTLPGLVRDRCDGSRVLLVADENTWAAAGEIVAAALEGEFTLSRYLFPAGVEAAMANCYTIAGSRQAGRSACFHWFWYDQ